MASASDKPALLKINYDNGHFTEDKQVTFKNFASQYAFMLWQTGHTEFQPTASHSRPADSPGPLIWLDSRLIADGRELQPLALPAPLPRQPYPGGMSGRTFAIGDIHGRHHVALFELLSRCLPSTENDTIVFVGDYVDRGPRSAQVIDYIRRLHVE